MNTEKIVLAITGPAGAGKSTVAGELAKQIDQCVNIDADDVKHFIANGFIYGNDPDGLAQWSLLGKNIGILAKSFHESGYNVIINGYINEPAWHALEAHVSLTHKVLLLPHIDTIYARDVGRDEDVRMGDQVVTEHHAYFSGSSFYDDFTKLDTADQRPEETVNSIVEFLRK